VYPTLTASTYRTGGTATTGLGKSGANDSPFSSYPTALHQSATFPFFLSSHYDAVHVHTITNGRDNAPALIREQRIRVPHALGFAVCPEDTRARAMLFRSTALPHREEADDGVDTYSASSSSSSSSVRSGASHSSRVFFSQMAGRLLSRPERVFVFARGGIVLLQMAPAMVLMASLLSRRPPLFEQALSLCDQVNRLQNVLIDHTDIRWDLRFPAFSGMGEAKVRQIRSQFGYQLFEKCNFELAFFHLHKAQEPVRRVVALVPQFLPSNIQLSGDFPVNVEPLLDTQLPFAVEPYVSYLMSLRPNIYAETVGTPYEQSANGTSEERVTDADIPSTLSLVDTVLIRAHAWRLNNSNSRESAVAILGDIRALLNGRIRCYANLEDAEAILLSYAPIVRSSGFFDMADVRSILVDLFTSAGCRYDRAIGILLEDLEESIITAPDAAVCVRPIGESAAAVVVIRETIIGRTAALVKYLFSTNIYHSPLFLTCIKKLLSGFAGAIGCLLVVTALLIHSVELRSHNVNVIDMLLASECRVAGPEFWLLTGKIPGHLLSADLTTTAYALLHQHDDMKERLTTPSQGWTRHFLICWLEHIVLHEEDREDSALLDALAAAYVSTISESSRLRGRDMSGQLAVLEERIANASGIVGEYRQRLFLLLKSSNRIDASLLLRRFPGDGRGLWEERSMLLRRLERHGEALQIYVQILKDFDAAERYCIDVCNRADASRIAAASFSAAEEDVFVSLLRAHLGSTSSHPTAITMEEEQSAALAKVIAVLSRHSSKIRAKDALELIPDNAKLSAVSLLLLTASSHSNDKKSAMAVSRQLMRHSNIDAGISLVQKQSRAVVIDRSTRCHTCGKKIRLPATSVNSAPAAFVTLWSDSVDVQPKVVHLACHKANVEALSFV
jgi:hypothetical protein